MNDEKNIAARDAEHLPYANPFSTVAASLNFALPRPITPADNVVYVKDAIEILIQRHASAIARLESLQASLPAELPDGACEWFLEQLDRQ